MICPCKQNTKPELPSNVLEIVNPERPVLFHKVPFAASLGDDTTVPPDTLEYYNVLLEYEANHHAYLYSSDGVPTFISQGAVETEKIEAQLKEIGIQITDITSQLGDLDSSVTTLKTYVDATFEAINDNINNFENELINTNASVDANTQNITNLTDKVTANASNIATLSTNLTGLNTEVNTAQSDIVTLKSGLANEAQERTNADSLLRESIATNTSSIETINSHLDVSVEQLTAFNGNDSTMDVVHTKINLGNGETTETTDALPVASTTNAGIINAATFSSIQESAKLIDSILQGAVALKGIAANVDQDTLTTLWKGASGESELINRASIYDEDNNRIWTYYGNTGEWKSLTATSGGEVTVSQATNDSLGIVKGSTLAGQIFVEPDGSQSVNEWDETQERITNLESSMTTETERTKNLPAQVVYRTSIPEYKEDEVDLTLVVKDLHTGGDASIPLNLMGATENTAGVMTSAQVQSLTEVANQLPTTMQDVDDALGDIAAIQADYVGKNNIKTINGESLVGTGNIEISGSGVQLYDAYSTATDGANTANFINTKLNGQQVIIGRHTSNAPTGAQVVAIGYNCKTSGSNNSNVVIGYSAQVKGTSTSSVALGAYSRTTRDGEVSIGGGSDATPATRFLSNVTAGTLDTDAVNLKQMQDYVAAEIGVPTAALIDLDTGNGV